MHEGIPGSEVLVLEHSAHGVAEADVPEFRETVTRFLARLAGGLDAARVDAETVDVDALLRSDAAGPPAR